MSIEQMQVIADIAAGAQKLQQLRMTAALNVLENARSGGVGGFVASAIEGGHPIGSGMRACVFTPIAERLSGADTATKEFHELRRLLDERAFYPPHPPRVETNAYKKVHADLVKGNPCLICGVTYETLHDSRKIVDRELNPYAAKQLETHHHVIEWALANAVDETKFNARVLPHLKARHGGRYGGPLSAKEVADWIDHDPDNLWVLCDVHHRSKFFGIHEITGPVWGPQDLLKDEFLAHVNSEITKAASVPVRKPPTRQKKEKPRRRTGK
jgi:hypothetical protein